MKRSFRQHGLLMSVLMDGVNISDLCHEALLPVKLMCSDVVQITMNAHASLSYMLAAVGINLVPTMPMIYVVFASLVSSLSSIQFSEYLGRWRLCCSPQIQQDRCFTSTVFTMLSSNFGL